MARKDVNLVIRAKDDASKAVERIAGALDDFVSSQAGLKGQSKATREALSSITDAAKKVEAALGSLDAGSKLKSQMDQVSDAISRLEKETSESKAAVDQNRTALDAAEKTAARYSARLDKAASAQERYAKSLKEAKAEVRANNAELKTATAEQEKLLRRQSALPDAINKQAAALQKSASRYDELAAKMAKAEKPSASLAKQFDASTRSVEKKRAALDALQAEYGEIGGKIAKAEGEVTQFAKRAEDAAQREAKLAEGLERLNAIYGEIGEKSRQAAKDQKTLEAALSGASKSAEKNAAGLEVARDALDQITVASQQAEQALAGLTGEALGSIEKQLVDQGIAAREAKREFEELEGVVETLKHEIGGVGVPTREMSQSLAMAAQAADEAQFRLMAQEEALGRMSAAYREQNGDLQSIVAAQRSFAAAQERLGSSLDSVANDGFKARQAIRELHVEMDSGATEREARNIRSLGNEADKAAPKVSRLQQAYNQLYGGSRQSLSYTQRLRGEVLSMIAAYGGLYGVVETLNSVVRAYQKLEGAQSRLNVVTNNDSGKTAQEMDFLRRNADRLGIELGLLADEYTKFAIATKGTNLEGQRTRNIFLSIAEAARAARIPNEELSGIFKAATQIVSKEKLSLEELQEQMGDRLPRAVRTMADALGLTVGELQKLMEQGKVTADSLAPFADQLDKQFGGQLEASLQGVTAQLGRLQNAAFQAMIVFAEAGFMEAFEETLQDLTDLMKSGEFESFLERLSAGFATAARAASFVANNFGIVAGALGAALGLKSLNLLTTFAEGIASWRDNAKAAAVESAAAAQKARALGAASATASVGVGRLATALRAVSSVAWPLILAAAGGFAANWLTSATDVNDALSAHREIMDDVKNAYDETEGSVEGWADALKDLTLTEAEENLRRMTEQLQKTREDLLSVFMGDGESVAARVIPFASYFSGADQAYNEAIESIITTYMDGESTAREFMQAVDDVNTEFNDGSAANRRYANDLIAVARKLIELEEGSEQARKVVTSLKGEGREAQEALDELGNGAEDSGKDLEIFREDAKDAAEETKKLGEAAADLKDEFRDLVRTALPDLAGHLDDLEKADAFSAQVGKVLSLTAEIVKANLKVDDLVSAWRGMKAEFEGTSFVGLFTDLLTDADSVIEKFTTIGTLGAGLGEKIAGGLSTIGGVMSDAVGTLGGAMTAFGKEFQAKFADALRTAGMNEDYIKAAFSVAGGESNFNFTARENPNYSPDRAREMFSAARGMSDAELRALVAGGAEKFFEAMYGAGTEAGKRLGNTQPGDGGRYYGRGFIQLTGRSNYERYAGITGHDIVNDPDLMIRNTQVAVDVAAAYLADRMRETGDAVSDMRAAVAGGKNTAVYKNNIDADRARFESITIPGAGESKNYTANDGVAAAAGTRDSIADAQFAVEQQERINAGLERQAEIEEALRDARADNPAITQEQLDAIAEETGRLYDLRAEQEATNEAKREQERIDKDIAAAREATAETLSDAEFEVRQQQLKNDGLERQAAIEAAIRDARKADKNITDEELAALTRSVGKQYDLANANKATEDAKKAAAKAQEVVNQLMSQRNALEAQFQQLLKDGDTAGAAAIKDEIAEVNNQMIAAIDNAKQMWAAVGGQEAATATAELQSARMEAEAFGRAGQKAKFDWTGVTDLIVNGLSGAVDDWAQRVANGEDKMDALRNSFLQFASDFLRQIAQMILKQMILNTLKSAFGGTPFGNMIGIPIGLGHTGGNVGSKRVGSGNATRRVNPAIFAGAMRYHEGGIPGLKPGEVPIIAKQNEEILTKDDPRHWSNQGSGGAKAAPAQGAKVYNYFDFESFLEASLSGAGGKAILNHVRANSSEFRAAMEG